MSLSPFSQQLIHTCARRQLAGPLLLFVAGHRPLAFACGQTLYAMQPLAELLGVDACGELAADLSRPESARSLEAALLAAAGPAERDR